MDLMGVWVTYPSRFVTMSPNIEQSLHLYLLQNSPLPPSLGAMPPFSMMNPPPRPLHMNGSRPSLHPGISKGIADDAARVDWVTSQPPIALTATRPGSQHTRTLKLNLIPYCPSFHFVASSEEVIYKNSLLRQPTMSLKKRWCQNYSELVPFFGGHQPHLSRAVMDGAGSISASNLGQQPIRGRTCGGATIFSPIQSSHDHHGKTGDHQGELRPGSLQIQKPEHLLPFLDRIHYWGS